MTLDTAASLAVTRADELEAKTALLRDAVERNGLGLPEPRALATPGSRVEILPPVAMAWNPSLPGSKIEDTVLRTDEGLEVLTVDPAWPMVEVDGRERPDFRILG